ncbi:MAG: DNA-directed RNA polymerase subunit B'' [Candidatus Undinarchaeales archaeon]
MAKRKYDALVEGFVRENGLVGHQISSYNSFVKEGMQKIVDEMEVIDPEIEDFEVRLENIKIGKPSVKEANGAVREILPNEARLRDLSYSAPLFLEMVPIKNGTEGEKILPKIGELPVMLHSDLCPLSGMSKESLIQAGEDPEDPGGYFIVNGTERVLVLVEDLSANRMNMAKPKIGTVTEKVRVFSTSGWYRRRNSIEYKKDGNIFLSSSPFNKQVPFVIILKALGVEKESEIAQMVSPVPEVQNELYVSFEEAEEVKNREEALDYLGKRIAFGQSKEDRMDRAERVLDTFILPHIGVMPGDRKNKARYLARMVEKVIKLHLGKIGLDDKDNYSNKRLRLAGRLFEDLFRVTFRALVNNTVYSLEKAYKRNRKLSVLTAIRSNFLTERIQHAIATGAWIGNRKGVSQHLDRLNYLSALSHRRRVRSLLSTAQPHFEARDLHATHWGRLCPNETPEGSNIGLVKNLALLAKITEESDDAMVEEHLGKKSVLFSTELKES